MFKMRVLTIVMVFLFISATASAQSKFVLQPHGELRIDDYDDNIITQRLLPTENKLLLVGQKNIRLWDLTTAKLVAVRPIGVANITEDQPRVISPSGRFMVVFGNYNSRAKADKIKRPASIWSLETGSQVAVLDNTTKPIQWARWSEDEKILVTSSYPIGEHTIDPNRSEISFWDGETFRHLSALSADNINWSYLTADGTKFFYSVATVKNWVIDKFLRDSGGPIRVWNVKNAKLEQTFLANVNDADQGMRSISVSPDERFLTFVTQPLKSKDVERTLVVCSVDKASTAYTINRKYEIKPTLQINEWGAAFSPDGKYLALVTGKEGYWNLTKGLVLEIYQTESGRKIAELNAHYSPDNWFNDNQILLYYNYGGKMEAVETANGNKLYEDKLIYRTHEITRTTTVQSKAFPGLSDRKTRVVHTTVTDQTKVVRHPSGRMFLTYSNQYVRVYDAQTGSLLQTLVEPRVETSKPADPKKGPKLSSAPAVSKADWFNHGNAVYIVSADKRSVSFWSLN